MWSVAPQGVQGKLDMFLGTDCGSSIIWVCLPIVVKDHFVWHLKVLFKSLILFCFVSKHRSMKIRINCIKSFFINSPHETMSF